MQYAARGDGDFVIKRLEIDDVFDSFDRVDQCEPHGRAEGPCVIGHLSSLNRHRSSNSNLIYVVVDRMCLSLASLDYRYHLRYRFIDV
jgi:hypothetical protein